MKKLLKKLQNTFTITALLMSLSISSLAPASIEKSSIRKAASRALVITAAVGVTVGFVYAFRFWQDLEMFIKLGCKNNVMNNYYIDRWGRQYMEMHPEKRETEWVMDDGHDQIANPWLSDAGRASLETKTTPDQLLSAARNWTEFSQEAKNLWGDWRFWHSPGILPESRISYWRNRDGSEAPKGGGASPDLFVRRSELQREFKPFLDESTGERFPDNLSETGFSSEYR